MSGLFSWATDALASVTSSVIAPFRGDTTPVKAEFHVSSKQTYRKQAPAAKAKKRAQAKRRAQLASKKVDGTERDGEQVQATTTSTTTPVSYEPDEQTKIILAKMAEAAERRAQEEREAEEAEIARQKKREEDLANSCVREMPIDPMAEERAAIMTEIKAELKSIGTGEEFKRLDEFQQAMADKQRALNEVSSKIEAAVRSTAKKCPRPASDKANMSPEELREMIQDEELSEERNNLEIKSLCTALVGVISQRNQKEFFNQMQDLQNEVSSQRARLASNLEKVRLDDSRQKAIDRLVVLYDSANDPEAKLVKANVVGKNMDLPMDFNKLNPHLRKIEKRFRCIVVPPRQRQQSRATVKVWGHEEDVDDLIEWVKQSDWSGTQFRSYDRRVGGMIVGRGGMTIQQIEMETGTILNLDNNNNLVAYGIPEDIEEVWKKIDALKAETRAQPITRTVTIDPRIGRGILAYHRAKIQALEDQYQCRINIWLQPEEGQPRVVVKCSSEKQEEIMKEVERVLVDGFTVLDFEGSARAVSRLLIPQRMPGRASNINNEFRSFQTDLVLFVQRESGKTEDQSTLWVVCSSKDKDLVRSTIEQLLKKADYSTERISIMREQQRIFNAENRGLIEASSGGCRVSIVNNANEGTVLMLVGSDECLAKGKEIVRDILAREGAVETIKLGGGDNGPAVVDYLLRDRAAVLRSMEDLHAVSIHIDRENNTARVVGDPTAIANAAKELSEIDTEIARSQEDTIRMVISVDADKIPVLIGRAGSTVQQIRHIPGVQSVDIPQASADASVVEVVLVGRSAALEEAQSFIEGVINRSANNDQPPATGPIDYGDRIGRGRGRRTRRNNGPERGSAPFDHQPMSLQFEESAFPALGEVVTVDDA